METFRQTCVMHRLSLEQLHEAVTDINPEATSETVEALKGTFLQTLEHMLAQNREFETFFDYLSLVASGDPQLQCLRPDDPSQN